jgi:superfamily II DNA/RNA helicase
VEVGIRFSAAETVSHYMYPVASDQREELLLAILKQTHFESLMIFTRTKMQADQLYSALQQEGNYKAALSKEIPLAESKARQAWGLWGGDPMRTAAERAIREAEKG